MVETYYICNKIASHWPNVWKKVKINYIDRSISQVYVQLQLQSKQFILELSNNGKVGSITGSISSTFYWSIHEVTLEPSWLSLENLIISASNYYYPTLSVHQMSTSLSIPCVHATVRVKKGQILLYYRGGLHNADIGLPKMYCCARK